MKKVLIAVMLLAVLVGLCACSYSSSFMPRATVNSLAKKYGTPQAEVTLTYTKNDIDYTITLIYDLLLEQAPVAVTRFIQLANDGAYDNSIVDTYNSTNSYYIMGRYNVIDEKYYFNNLGNTFVGEFATNNYRQPASGYAQCSMFALAMYHPDLTASSYRSDCNTADGTLILTMKSNSLNADDYAFFAKLNTLSYQVGDGTLTTYPDGKVPAFVRDNFVANTSKTSRDVYEETTSTRLSIMSTKVTLTVKMLGDHDWSKLPKIG